MLKRAARFQQIGQPFFHNMKITFLGTGTSTGVPEIGCRCIVCQSLDNKDKRRRASIKIEMNEKNIFIDCSPDFREQTMLLPFKKIDAILITHEHYDHTGGIDDLRPFTRFNPVDLYAETRVSKILKERLYYCFVSHKYGGVPELRLHDVLVDIPFFIGNIFITPIRVMHHKLPILGYRVGDMVYLTDLKTLPEKELKKLEGLKVLIISALRKEEHLSHQNLSQAIALAKRIGAQITYFTHMSHHMGLHEEVSKELPPGFYFAYDGLEIEI